MADKTTTTSAALLLAAATVGTLVVGITKDSDGLDVTTYDGASLSELPERLKVPAVLDAKTLQVVQPESPRHLFGRGGDCAKGSRYCSVIYDAATDKLDLSHCYAVVQMADADGEPYTDCQVTADVWRKMREPAPDLDDGPPPKGDADLGVIEIKR